MNHSKPQSSDSELSNCTTVSREVNPVCVCVCDCALPNPDAGLDLSPRLQRSDYSIDGALFYSFLISLGAALKKNPARALRGNLVSVHGSKRVSLRFK